MFSGSLELEHLPEMGSIKLLIQVLCRNIGKMTISELNADIATITYSLTFLLYLLQHRVTPSAFKCYILSQTDCWYFLMFARNNFTWSTSCTYSKFFRTCVTEHWELL